MTMFTIYKYFGLMRSSRKRLKSVSVQAAVLFMFYINRNSYQRIHQRSKAPIGNAGHVGGVEGAEEPKHDDVHSQDQQHTGINGEIVTGLKTEQKDNQK